MNYLFHAAAAGVVLALAPPLALACSCLDSIGICQKPPDPANPDRAVFIGVVSDVYPKSREEMDQIRDEFRRLHPELINRSTSPTSRRTAADPAPNLEFRKEFIKYLWRDSLSPGELEQLQNANWRDLDRLMLDYRLRVRIRVTENFHGADGEIFEAYTPLDSAACGFSFAAGQTYLVEASRTVADGRWQVFTCSRTETLAKAADDVEWLRAWKQGRTLAGWIQGLADPGARIRLLGGGRTLETTADHLGLFEFKNLERRTYDVQVAGDTERRQVDLAGSGCAQVFLPRK